MGSNDLQIAALHTGSAAIAAENALVPQTQAASPVLPARGVSAAATPPTIQISAPAVAAAPPAQTTAGTQSPVATALAHADATATVTTASASSTAPAQQTLQQLDRVLQQLGIDPQTLSLMSREGMLNWVNDPAALRQIVQNVQAAASTSQQNGAVGAANPTRSAAQASVASANQNQIQSQTLSQPQAAAQETNSASGSTSTASSANTNALDQSAATAQQNATAVMQFQIGRASC